VETCRAQLKYTHLNAAIPQNECGASVNAHRKGCAYNTSVLTFSASYSIHSLPVSRLVWEPTQSYRSTNSFRSCRGS